MPDSKSDVVEPVPLNLFSDFYEKAVFPGNSEGPNGKFFYIGISKRELFAAMAMQGLVGQYAQGGDFMEGHVATGAVKMADALLKELAK